MLDRIYSQGRYARYLPSLTCSLMHHLHLKESDIFFNRVRVHARDVSLAFHHSLVIDNVSSGIKLCETVFQNVVHAAAGSHERILWQGSH